MADRVLQRLLRDPEQLVVAVALVRRHAVELELDLGRAGLDAAQHLDVLAQRRREPVALELGRAQLEDQVAQLLEQLQRELPQPVDLLAGALDVDVQQRARRLGREREGEELLRDRVVQLERQAVALVEDRELAAALVQPGVRDRDRRVRGQQLDQLLVRRARTRPRPPCR